MVWLYEPNENGRAVATCRVGGQVWQSESRFITRGQRRMVPAMLRRRARANPKATDEVSP